MAGLFISKRAVFPRGEQRNFILNNKKALGLLDVELARLLKISNRTLTDWKREKFSMSLRAVEVLSKKTKKKIPQNIKIKNPFWYIKKGAKLGGIAVYKKYGRIGGDPEYRKKKWYEWWEKEGKYKCIITAPKSFRKPIFSKELAEFAGIVLGDGGITQRQITITLHHKDDREYSRFVIVLIKNLFDVPVGVCHRKENSTIDLIVSRSGLVSFCKEKLGLKQGNKIKQQVDIPDWIKKSKSYLISCIRGLMDTDGCIFMHKYKVNGKWYNYKKLSFSNHSKPLINSVFEGFRRLNMSPRITKDGRDVRIERKNDVYRYFAIVNPHNHKYLKRYKK